MSPDCPTKLSTPPERAALQRRVSLLKCVGLQPLRTLPHRPSFPPFVIPNGSIVRNLLVNVPDVPGVVQQDSQPQRERAALQRRVSVLQRIGLDPLRTLPHRSSFSPFVIPNGPIVRNLLFPGKKPSTVPEGHPFSYHNARLFHAESGLWESEGRTYVEALERRTCIKALSGMRCFTNALFHTCSAGRARPRPLIQPTTST